MSVAGSEVPALVHVARPGNTGQGWIGRPCTLVLWAFIHQFGFSLNAEVHFKVAW